MAIFKSIQEPVGLCSLTASELIIGYQKGEFTPVETIRSVFDRYEEINQTVNALYEIDRDEALRAAFNSEQRWLQNRPLSPMDGVPVSVKDHLQVRGMSSPRGFLFGSRNPLNEDCASVHKLRQGGAIVFGKSTMPELSIMPVTESTLFGQTRHPRALHLSPGGSSGGAAAAVRAGIGPLALGSDGGGSNRIPAAFTGLVGLKPTHGRVPYFPSPTNRTVAGPIGRTVSDVARMMNVIARYDSRDWTSMPPDFSDYLGQIDKKIQPQRIAVSYGFGIVEIDTQIRQAVDAAAEWLSSLGHVVEKQEVICDDALPISNVLAAAGMQELLGNLTSEQRGKIAPSSISALEQFNRTGLHDYRNMEKSRERLASQLNLIFKKFDVILSPTVPHGPIPLGKFFPKGDILSEECRRVGTLTRVFNVVYLPGVSVPFGHFDNELPIGVHLAAGRFQDVKILQLARQLELAF